MNAGQGASNRYELIRLPDGPDGGRRAASHGGVTDKNGTISRRMARGCPGVTLVPGPPPMSLWSAQAGRRHSESGGRPRAVSGEATGLRWTDLPRKRIGDGSAYSLLAADLCRAGRAARGCRGAAPVDSRRTMRRLQQAADWRTRRSSKRSTRSLTASTPISSRGFWAAVRRGDSASGHLGVRQSDYRDVTGYPAPCQCEGLVYPP